MAKSRRVLLRRATLALSGRPHSEGTHHLSDAAVAPGVEKRDEVATAPH
jgi:hypothetical protein